ncbi:hypothetical protein C8F04DRAFT_1269659 [Mycena alexandri]|uniref:Uncharacterized protein n=1 Tax=Mycena alexandri TaxID=1745969 RepID=A0AAD6SDM2_9AGAR|nr:hypothetical protein C8F04DRAFT_1269659 [Mycena alexandri]
MPSTTAGTLRSGKEFGTHGAILLADFDVLEHAQTARDKTSTTDLASDDHPISTAPLPAPDKRTSPSVRARSQSPPRRSARLVPTPDNSIDRGGRTRAARRASEQARLGTPLKRVVRNHVDNAQPIQISTAPADYPVTSTGWSGIREQVTEQREYTIAELQDEFHMTILPWDGRTSRPLVDKESRVIAVLGGRPNDPEYLQLTEQAARELEAARAELNFRPEQRGGRRGTFSSASAGISFGGGQQVPGNLSLPAAMALVFQRLFALSCFFRIAGFANGKPLLIRLLCPQNLIPPLQGFFKPGTPPSTLWLRRNFNRRFSVFAAATFNFGPATVTFPHIDALNLAWGWCAITALGFFNPDVGGHLVLWDLRLIIRFPPGSTILIPSAILRHSNVTIAAGERRYSFTQYTAAGLFRWVDNGFRTEAGVEDATRHDLEAQAARVRARQTRWSTGINSYMRWTPRRS